MLSESEKRAASLAVSRFGADRARVQQIARAVAQARASGKAADLLENLVLNKLLTSAQANELRLSLADTHFDPNATPRSQPANLPAQPAAQAGTTPRSLAALIEGPAFADPNEYELHALGEFRILRRLGEGGMGAVYLGYQESEDRQFAIKVLSEHLAGSQASIDRFYREAKSGALLNHPNIVRNIVVGQDQATGKHYLVLEYVDGPSAQGLLERYGRLRVSDAVHVVLDVAKALEHAHSRSVVHRDIKPGNILITQSGVAKLADLGLAKRTDEASHLTAARQGFGTPYYMPYEQAMNAKYADGRSDIYALGATLYHLVTGEVPFPGHNPLEIVDKKGLGAYPPAGSLNPEVPPVLDEILARMLARNPADRYQTASELIVDLERSGLAAAVPSFADPDRALQDPLVRERLTAPAQATCPDLRAIDGTAEAPRSNPDVWYLRYRDSKGNWCKSKATTQQVLQRLQEGRLPADLEASHDPRGTFQPLGAFPEFRSVMALSRKSQTGSDRRAVRNGPVEKTQGPPETEKPARRWWLFLTLGVGLMLAAGGVVARMLLTS